MGIRRRLRKLESAAQEEMIVIPQREGTVACFPAEEGMEAYMNLMDRLGAGENGPPEHPLIAVARNSSESKWSQSFFAVNDPDEWVTPVEDHSES